MSVSARKRIRDIIDALPDFDVDPYLRYRICESVFHMLKAACSATTSVDFISNMSETS